MIRELEAKDLNNGFLDCIKELHEPDLNKANAVFLERDKFTYNSFTYVYDYKGKIIGTASLMLHKKFGHEGRYAAFIEDVATHKEHQGKGVGKELVKFLIELSKSFGAYKINLSCSEKNTEFYSKFGFKKSEVTMRLDL